MKECYTADWAASAESDEMIPHDKRRPVTVRSRSRSGTSTGISPDTTTPSWRTTGSAAPRRSVARTTVSTAPLPRTTNSSILFFPTLALPPLPSLFPLLPLPSSSTPGSPIAAELRNKPENKLEKKITKALKNVISNSKLKKLSRQTTGLRC